MTFVERDGGQIFANFSADKVNIFGFENTTSGLLNSNANRIWTAKPTDKAAKPKLLYGIQLTNVPTIHKWKYSITFGKSPPLSLKMFPENGICGVNPEDQNSIYVGIECFDEMECEDGDINIIKVTFEPIKDDLPTPEQVENKTTPAVTKTDDDPLAGVAGSGGKQVAGNAGKKVTGNGGKKLVQEE